MRKIWIWLVKMSGWHFDVPSLEERPELMHCVVAVAPHTSFKDFFIGPAVLYSIGANPRIFMKADYFNWFTRPLFHHFGVYEVDRGNRHNDIVGSAVRLLNAQKEACVVLTPEATRKPVKRFKRGFYEIAQQANVPIVLGYMDFEKKVAGYGPTIIPTGDFEADCKKMIDFFAPVHACHPEGWYFGLNNKHLQ